MACYNTRRSSEVWRVRKGGNARFFYCYDDGAAVWVLNGYEKKTEKIPLREIRQAKRLKRKYGL